jgi:hypothetical protein
MLEHEPRGQLTDPEATIMTTSTTPTIVFVHGGFADASGFAGVIRELQSAGHRVLAISVMVSAIGADPTVSKESP